MNWSFRKRITWVNTVAVAILAAIVFVCIYAVVYYSSYKHLDDDILKEKDEVLNNLDWDSNKIILEKMPEWDEAEHKQLEANPTFIQIVNNSGETIFKSANLHGETFLFNPKIKDNYFFNDIANHQRLRFGQFPVYNESKKIIGHLTIAVSQQESYIVLHNLLLVLIVSYIFLLITLFAILWYAASQAIKPVTRLISAASNINENNISERLPLPDNKDEIYQLATTINDLLERLETAMLQQKQFTADVSHEMRTPLTAIKGTLEVLLRKERSPGHYQEKVKGILAQANRLTSLYDEMLTLSKIDAANMKADKKEMLLHPLIERVVHSFSFALQEKNITVKTDVKEDVLVNANAALLEIILNNLVSNAIKYNRENGSIIVKWSEEQQQLAITDTGIGISSEQLSHIFNRFYRTDHSRSSNIKGYGLGLSIVKKLCDLQNIAIDVNSEEGSGSEFILKFITQE